MRALKTNPKKKRAGQQSPGPRAPLGVTTTEGRAAVRAEVASSHGLPWRWACPRFGSVHRTRGLGHSRTRGGTEPGVGFYLRLRGEQLPRLHSQLPAEPEAGTKQTRLLGTSLPSGNRVKAATVQLCFQYGKLTSQLHFCEGSNEADEGGSLGLSGREACRPSALLPGSPRGARVALEPLRHCSEGHAILRQATGAGVSLGG